MKRHDLPMSHVRASVLTKLFITASSISWTWPPQAGDNPVPLVRAAHALTVLGR